MLWSGFRGRPISNELNSRSCRFAGYVDSRYEGWGPLRVLNEDVLQGDKGFAPHAHDNFEIFSYILQGQLHHKDSMGNEEVIGRGGIQFTSAGKGITHSEYNADATVDAKLLQVWVKPDKQNLKPSYRTKHFSDDAKRNQLLLILSHDGRDGSIRIHQQCDIYASILMPQEALPQAVELAAGRVGYVHLTLGGSSLKISEAVTLSPGDGAYLSGPLSLQLSNSGKKKPAEFLFFDLPRAS